jgi:hypothetical protein
MILGSAVRALKWLKTKASMASPLSPKDAQALQFGCQIASIQQIANCSTARQLRPTHQTVINSLLASLKEFLLYPTNNLEA